MSAPGQTTHFWSSKARVEGDETGRQKEHASVRGGGHGGTGHLSFV